LLPTFLHFSGWIYLAGAAVLGAWFLHASVAAARRRTCEQSLRLLKSLSDLSAAAAPIDGVE